MLRRHIRSLVTTAAATALALSLGAQPAGALIDADSITGPLDSVTAPDLDPRVDGGGGSFADTVGVDDWLDSLGGVDCANNFTDERTSGAALDSTPNPLNDGFGQTSRCVGEGDHASLGDDNDVTIHDNDQDNEFFDCDASATADAGSGTDPSNSVLLPWGTDPVTAVAVCEEADPLLLF